ncbi:MAG: oligosaccharide flippase family protein [Actinomycetota bacterium]
MITTIGNALPPAVLLLTQILLAKSLGVSGRGTVAAATAPLLLAVAIFTLGLPESLTYFVSRDRGRLVRKVGISLAALVLAGVLGTGLVAYLAQPLSAGSRQLADLMTLAGAALVPALFTAALRGVAYGAHAWWLVAAERTLGAAVQLVSIYALYVNGSLTVGTATIAVAASTFAGIAVYLLSPRWWAALRGPKSEIERESETSSMFSYAWRIWAGSIAGIILARLDQVMVTPLAGVDELGIYAVAVNASNVALLFHSAVGQVIFTVEAGDPSATRVGRAARMTTLVTALASAVLAAASPWLIPGLFGSEFAQAVPVLIILLLAYAIAIPGSVAGGVLSARGYPGLRSMSMLISTVPYVIVMLVLVPRYGAAGAAVAMFVGTVLPGYLNIYLLIRYCDVPPSEFYRFRRSDLDVLRRAFDWLMRAKRRSTRR